MKPNELLVYPIHKDDAERLGIEINLTVDDGGGLILTPRQVKEAVLRFDKSGHENPIKHRDLAYGVGGFVEMVHHWRVKHDDLYQERAALQEKLREAQERE